MDALEKIKRLKANEGMLADVSCCYRAIRLITSCKTNFSEDDEEMANLDAAEQVMWSEAEENLGALWNGDML